jgi:hypothetical protein
MNSAVFHRPLSLAIAVLLSTSLAPALLAAEEQDPAIAARAAMVCKIDERINERLAAAKIDPAPLADDGEFLRRVYLDLTGVVPRVSEVREFLADKRAGKRSRLIDKLLDSPAHSTHLANTWRNIMLPGGLNIEQINNVVGVQNWLRARFVDNLRYDNMVSELLVATEGDDVGPALYYTSLDLAPEKLAGSTARIFLGLQIECAECHDHPHDKWKQTDFWGYAAFFAQLQKPDMAGNPAARARLVDLNSGDVKLPKSEEIVLPKFPGGASPDLAEVGTRRVKLAIWMASRDNPYLPRAGANRVWAHLFGRGLVEPVDDLSPQNPPSHPELFEELTAYFVETGFDLRELFRTLANTQAYQRTSAWTAEKVPQPELYAHAAIKTLTAEQLYDSLNRVLSRKPQAMFPGQLAGSPLLDPQRQAFIAKMQSAARSPLDYQAGILQALTQMNGADIAEATDPQRSPLVGALEAPIFADGDRIKALVLATLSRQASDEEMSLFMAHLNKYSPSEKQKGISDILWVLLNTAEFSLNH